MKPATSKAITDLDGKRVWIHLDRTGELLGWSRVERADSFDHFTPSGDHRGSTVGLNDWMSLLAPEMSFDSPPRAPQVVPPPPRIKVGPPAWAIAGVIVLVAVAALAFRSRPLPNTLEASAAPVAAPLEGAGMAEQAFKDVVIVSRSPDGEVWIKVASPRVGGAQLQIVRGEKMILAKPFSGGFVEACWNSSGEYVAINNKREHGDHLWIIDLSTGEVLKEPGDRTGNAIRGSVQKVIEEEAQKRWSNYRLAGIEWSALGWREDNLLQLRAVGKLTVSSERHSERELRAEGLLRVGTAGVSIQSFVVPYSVATPKIAKQTTAPSAPLTRPEATPPQVLRNTKTSDSADTGTAKEVAPRRQPAMPQGQPMPGERFFETRTRLLGAGDLAEFDSEEVRYAINEMYARRGGVFSDKDLSMSFTTKSWYWPRANVTLDEIEKEFSAIETAHVHALARRRSEIAAMGKPAPENPPTKRRPPPARRDGVEDLDRY